MLLTDLSLHSFNLDLDFLGERFRFSVSFYSMIMCSRDSSLKLNIPASPLSNTVCMLSCHMNKQALSWLIVEIASCFFRILFLYINH